MKGLSPKAASLNDLTFEVKSLQENKLVCSRRHDTQYNETQANNTEHNETQTKYSKYNNAQPKNTIHNDT